MIDDVFNVMRGRDIPVRVCPRFHALAKKQVIGDKKARRKLKRETGKEYFASIREFSEYAAKELEKKFYGR